MNEPGRFFEDKDHAEDYVKYRLAFPDTVFERIVSYVKDGGCQLDTVVDVGCGTGHHSTLPLARVFLSTVGVDVSEEQIKQTPRGLENVTFHVSCAEDMNFIKDSSMDLVSVATAIHWLDIPPFYKEVDRILKPNGCLAVYWQRREPFENPQAQAIVDEMCQSTSEFRHEGLKKLFDRLELPDCPYGQWNDQSIFFTKRWTVDDFVRRESTDSYCRMYMKTYPKSTVLQDFKHRLTDVFRDESSDSSTSPLIDLLYKVNILLCRKPQKLAD